MLPITAWLLYAEAASGGHGSTMMITVQGWGVVKW